MPGTSGLSTRRRPSSVLFRRPAARNWSAQAALRRARRTEVDAHRPAGTILEAGDFVDMGPRGARPRCVLPKHHIVMLGPEYRVAPGASSSTATVRLHALSICRKRERACLFSSGSPGRNSNAGHKSLSNAHWSPAATVRPERARIGMPPGKNLARSKFSMVYAMVRQQGLGRRPCGIPATLRFAYEQALEEARKCDPPVHS